MKVMQKDNMTVRSWRRLHRGTEERRGTDPGEYVAVNMSLRVKSWCDILRAE